MRLSQRRPELDIPCFAIFDTDTPPLLEVQQNTDSSTWCEAD
eukprot:IDg5604t1